MAQGTVAPVVPDACGRCGAGSTEAGDDGATSEDVALPPGWSIAIEGGQPRWLCESCTRAHVRDIEAKLDEAWWDAGPADG